MVVITGHQGAWGSYGITTRLGSYAMSRDLASDLPTVGAFDVSHDQDTNIYSCPLIITYVY